MSPSKLPIHHQIRFETTIVKFFSWLQSELHKFLSGKSSLFDAGEQKAKSLNFQTPVISGDVLTISRHKLPGHKGKATKPSDLIPIIELEAKPTPDGKVEISIGYREKEPEIQMFAEAIWKKIIFKFQVSSNDLIEFEKLREEYKVRILLDDMYEIEIDSLENILRDFVLFEKAEYLKRHKLDIEKISDGNTRVKFQFRLSYYGNYGLIGDVVAQPLINSKTHIQVSYGGWLPYAEEPKRIYEESGKFFDSLANHLVKLFQQVDPRTSDEKKSPLKEPGPGAKQEDWFLYKFNCDKDGTRKFTHKMLGEKIGRKHGTVRNLYAEWLKNK